MLTIGSNDDRLKEGTMTILKGKTLKLEKLGVNKDKTVVVYGLNNFEDKKLLGEVFNGFLSKDRKLGDKLEAWKIYDTPNSFRVSNIIPRYNIMHFQVC